MDGVIINNVILSEATISFDHNIVLNRRVNGRKLMQGTVVATPDGFQVRSQYFE